MRILVACPMQSEYQNFKDALTKFSPKHDYTVCCVGVGKVESAMEVTHRLSKSEFALIVVVGYAAATNNFNLGDLVVPSKCRYSDVNVPDELEEVKPLTQIYTLSDLDDITIYTADSFITYTGVLDLRKKFGFREAIFDMESTAIAQVASAWGIEMLVLKMVSDLPENDTISDFNKFVEEHSDFTPFVAYLEMLDS